MALAVIVGLMSVTHGPAMALVAPEMAPSSHVGHIAEHSHHGQHAPAQPDNPSVPDCTVICYGLGCFQALMSAEDAGPLSRPIALAKLEPAVARFLIAALLDPADPPPRLQA